MAKILILTAATGGGHRQVASSLKDELTKYHHEIIEIEPLKEKSKVLDTVISDGYVLMAKRLPHFYGGVYKITNTERVNDKVAKATILTLREQLFNIIEATHPDLIITTHALFNNVISNMKKAGRVDIPLISMVTDFLAHRSYISECVDAYVVASCYTKKGLMDHGVLEEKIFTYGIPIRRHFYEKTSERDKNSKFTILIMGGSMGVKGIKSSVKSIINNVKEDINIIVVCGHNKFTKKYFDEKYCSEIEQGSLKVYGFTKEIDKLMDNCDVIVTKPGGLTTSEAIAKNIPMIIPYYIPGQEAENAKYLQQNGMAILVDKPEELDKVIIELLEYPEKLDEMKTASSELSNEQSLDGVIQLIHDVLC